MTLERLRIFVAVAERQHVTAAARDLNLTQSAVSNAVAALEAEHGIRLFDRVGRSVELNEMGRVFLPEARAVLSRAAAAEAVLADMGALRRGRVSVFASQTIAGYWLPPRLVRFHRDHPNVDLQVQIGNTQVAAQAVLDGVAEIGLVEGAVEEAALLQARVGTDRLAVMVAPDHPWAGRRRLSASDLVSSPWVLREPGSGTRSTLEEALGEAGVEPGDLQVAMSLPSNEAVLGAAEAGGGATALSESVARAALAAGRLVVAPFVLRERPFRLLRHADRYRSRAGEAFARSVSIPL
ncbi:LysR family transcriptional regulator [Caulobacter radicis]|nr:LysR family transcriptional regulator [Caulobacter radicis]